VKRDLSALDGEDSLVGEEDIVVGVGRWLG
jgi:hypothetical protein